MACVLSASNLSINNLPDNIILEILHYLSVKDLCTSGRVCRRWHRIVQDNRLWRHVDLRPYKLDLHKMWKVVRAHLSDILLSLHIRGYLDPNGARWKKQSISDAMLRDLKERCPNIRELSLHMCNMEGLSPELLPAKLHKLSITSSFTPNIWFEKFQENKTVPNLKSLDLSNSTLVNESSIKSITYITCLEELTLNGCYRINEKAITAISMNFTKLNRLELKGTGCTDLNLHHFARNLKELTHLNLASCGKITDGGLATLVSGKNNLVYVDITKCAGITKDGRKALSHIKEVISEDSK